MVLAPHPDDDVIAAGGLIQRVLESGGEVAVVFVTDGENNPWPQRFLERKLFLSNSDRATWGAMRRREALCSLARLGVGEGSAIFLEFPDQGIGSLARRGDVTLREALRKTIDDLAPTLIVSPSTFDQHSDHRAIAYYAHCAAPDATIATYVVHGNAPAERALCRLELSGREQKRKFDAIECHQSQLSLSRDRFLSYGGRSETFFRAEYDVVRVESALRERLIAVRHAMRVCFGAYPHPRPSGVQPAADVQDGAGDVPGLL
ncbi:MAG: PIG-L family deacetylase [Acidobacteriota bacterium]|nr:PIG-L family deacetylase [Acidobacteriota bacterium]